MNILNTMYWSDTSQYKTLTLRIYTCIYIYKYKVQNIYSGFTSKFCLFTYIENESQYFVQKCKSKNYFILLYTS